MPGKKLLALVCAATLWVPLAAWCENAERLIERYTALAGSKTNAQSLVTGLRDGTEVKLVRNGTTETFTPPTGKMGYGNVDHALALAEASLKDKGITRPTPAELEASVLQILQLRVDGMGWGQIAHAHGLKLGEVKRAEKPERVAKVERPEKPEKPAKPERPHKPK